MKQLNGRELAGYIKERQAREVRRLIHSEQIQPRLAILLDSDQPASITYTQLKQRYGEDINVVVDIIQSSPKAISTEILQCNQNESIQGIIVQLPLVDTEQTTTILNQVEASKDVDGLGDDSPFDPATAQAIFWLLAGYNIDLAGKQIAIVGQGRLVGLPLRQMMEQSGLTTQVYDETTNLTDLVTADIIITATGQPGLITNNHVKPGAVVVDAGTAAVNGRLVGDTADELHQRDDIIITPRIGGVGPLTICALFENLLQATRDTVGLV
jgi:methylenetetrahydrofolate dehydrogenase (NADP+)/methenyltetrahydrofolate cyclohydrolase